MKMEVVNPLECMDEFVVEAVKLSYGMACDYKCKKTVPRISDINESIPAHFVQELYFEVVTKERFEDVGAFDERDFTNKIKKREYHKFAPDDTEVKQYLNMLNVVYIDNEAELKNAPICEVW